MLLAGCATAPRWPEGRSLDQGVTPSLPKPPDSLRASLELTALAGGRKSSVTAAFSARPGQAYKLDLFGFPGVTAGGFLWRPDKWDLVVYDPGEYVEGAGARVDIGLAGIGPIPVHDLFSWLWGDFFPGDSAQARLPAGWAPAASAPGPNRGFTYPGLEGTWRVEFDPKTGLPRAAYRTDSAFRIEFTAWRVGAGAASPDRPVPRRVRFYRAGELVLEIKVSSVEDDPAWKRDPFFLRIPNGFRRVDRLKN
ncbi:MAG: hypothetical protein JF616_14610 [Fibrobacteres bacterium]|nr:hypothetical protein [Fibrobacterota bacterium]